MSDYGVFELGELGLQCGETLPEARLAYKTYGRLAPDRSNVILYPTSYGAQHFDTEWLIGLGRVLDPGGWFIVIPNMFTNGLSTSPSNCVEACRYGNWPAISHVDNIGAQRRLLREVFEVERLAFTTQDSRAETDRMPNAEFRPIESNFGHRAGNPTHCKEDEAVLRKAVQDLLEQ